MSAVIAPQPINPITPISTSRFIHAAVSESTGAAGMAMMMARITSPIWVTPRIWVKIEKTNGARCASSRRMSLRTILCSKKAIATASARMMTATTGSGSQASRCLKAVSASRIEFMRI